MTKTLQLGTDEDLPERFGKYHVIGTAGRGNMSVVYTGYDPYADRDVAIKVCNPRDADSSRQPLLRRLFFNEVQTAGMLDHPKLLKVFDAGEQDGLLYIVMEYVENGQTLAPYCRPSRLLPLQTVGRVIHACADALDYAHRCGVVHRDIKPTNIMLTADGLVKIGDFGVAQLNSAEGTQVLAIMGSPLYMSPEQAMDQPLNGQTDLYALGVVMFELLTGRPPFHGANLPQLIHKICHQPAPDVREHRPEVPAAMAAIVARALHKDQARRYASGHEMATDLAKVFQDLVTEPIDVSDEDKIHSMQALRFFAEFPAPELWELLRHSHWGRYQPGESIPYEGASDLSLFVVVSGQIEIHRDGAAIAGLKAGQCFGELGYLAGTRQAANLVARGESDVLKITSDVIERATESCQLRLHKAFTKFLVERLSRVQPALTVG